MALPAALVAVTVPALDEVPGLVHGFEQRLGPPGWETRESGRRRVGGALAPHGRVHFLSQVHGATVVDAPWDGTPEADAAVASVAGQLIGIETADCLPVLLVDPRRRLAAAAHAGWRGTAARVARRTVEALVARGSDPSDLIAALGPAIGPCCYEVGDELRAHFEAVLFRAGPRGRPHLDVRTANVRQLEAAGLLPPNIHQVDDCTACRPDVYHSFRREGSSCGRMVSFVGFSAA